MPTPFTHLNLMTPLAGSPRAWLPPEQSALLASHLGPFLLGTVAPDVRTISPLQREETHFYPIPPDPERPSMQTLLGKYPALARPWDLPPAQAVFLSGYLAHLWFDEFWHQQIIWPYHMEKDDWGPVRARFDIYNVLLGYLDARDKAKLNRRTGRLLSEAKPDNWLPFVPDSDLISWRDFMAEQLQPGVETHTIHILARRAHMTPDEFRAFIGDQAQMEKRVFAHTPLDAVEQAYQAGFDGSVKLIRRYLSLAEGAE